MTNSADEIDSLKRTIDSFAELTFIQRDINEKNKLLLRNLIEVFEALPVNPETAKLVKTLSRQFKKMVYTKLPNEKPKTEEEVSGD